MNFHVFDASVGWLGEVSPHTEFSITSLNTIKVFAKSGFESVFGLANILDSTDFASNAVDEVRGRPFDNQGEGRSIL